MLFSRKSRSSSTWHERKFDNGPWSVCTAHVNPDESPAGWIMGWEGGNGAGRDVAEIVAPSDVSAGALGLKYLAVVLPAPCLQSRAGLGVMAKGWSHSRSPNYNAHRAQSHVPGNGWCPAACDKDMVCLHEENIIKTSLPPKESSSPSAVVKISVWFVNIL